MVNGGSDFASGKNGEVSVICVGCVCVYVSLSLCLFVCACVHVCVFVCGGVNQYDL